MNDTRTDTESPGPHTVPAPPRPEPVAPTRAQLRAAAACVAALAYHHRGQLAESSLPLAQPDLHWLLIAHLTPALHLVGLHNAPASQNSVLRLVFAALKDAAAVRTDDLAGYLEAITIRQQQDLLALAHQNLQPAEHAGTAAAGPQKDGGER